MITEAGKSKNLQSGQVHDPGRADATGPSLKAFSTIPSRREASISLYFCSWMRPTHTMEAICFIESTNLNINLFQTYSKSITEKHRLMVDHISGHCDPTG